MQRKSSIGTVHMSRTSATPPSAIRCCSWIIMKKLAPNSPDAMAITSP